MSPEEIAKLKALAEDVCRHDFGGSSSDLAEGCLRLVGIVGVSVRALHEVRHATDYPPKSTGSLRLIARVNEIASKAIEEIG
jgi:hypothetical protein